MAEIIQTEEISQPLIRIFFIQRPEPIQKSITDTKPDIQIVNLSHRKLNTTEIKLLEKGLKFTQTPRNSNIKELSNDISEFTHKVHLVEFFDGCEDEDESLVRNESNFVPPQEREEISDNFISNTTYIRLEPIEKSNVERNISFSEQKTITFLASDETIVIKQADKGGAQSSWIKNFTKIKLKHYYSIMHITKT